MAAFNDKGNSPRNRDWLKTEARRRQDLGLSPHPEPEDALGAAKAILIAVSVGLLLAMVLWSVRCRADPYVTAGIGRGELRHPGDNKWWIQKGWDYTIDENSTVWRLGAGWRFNRYLAVEANYHDLGKYEHFAGFMLAEDHYSASSPTLCVNGCTATQWGYLSGHAHAVSLTALPRLPLADNTALFARVGLAWFEATYTARIETLDPMARGWQEMGETDRGVAQVLGFGAEYHGITLEATKFRGVKAGPNSPYQSATTYTLGYNWSF